LLIRFSRVSNVDKYILFRRQNEDEIRFHNILSAKDLQKRRKVNNINMKTTFICWLVEFVGSFLSIFGPFITGHRNVGWGIIQVLILTVYFIMLPFTYLINSRETKATIFNFNWISALAGVFQSLIAGLWKLKPLDSPVPAIRE
jgi:hypothetical protein